MSPSNQVKNIFDGNDANLSGVRLSTCSAIIRINQLIMDNNVCINIIMKDFYISFTFKINIFWFSITEKVEK